MSGNNSVMMNYPVIFGKTGTLAVFHQGIYYYHVSLGYLRDMILVGNGFEWER